MFLSVSNKEKEEKSEEVKYVKQELNRFERFHARMPILEGVAWYQSLLGIQSVITWHHLETGENTWAPIGTRAWRVVIFYFGSGRAGYLQKS